MKTPAPNWRFAASGGVIRPKDSADFETLYPAGSVVEAALAKPLLRYLQPLRDTQRKRENENLKKTKKNCTFVS